MQRLPIVVFPPAPAGDFEHWLIQRLAGLAGAQ